MQTTFSRVAKLIAAPLAVAFLEFSFGLAAVGAQDDDKDNSRSSRQASADDDSRNSSESNRDADRSDQGPGRSRQSDQHHKALGVTLNEDSAGNLYVLRVLRDSPAEQAGVKKGDEILTVDGHRVSHTKELKRALARAEDDTVELGILRRGRHQTMKAMLADTDEVFGSDSERNRAGNQRIAQSGRMDDGSPNARRRSNSYAGDNRNSGRMNYHRGAALGIALDRGPRDGAWVTDVFPNSPADEAGIQPGDEIMAIDGRKVRSAEAVIQTISQMQAGDRIALDIDRNGDEKTIKTKLVRHEDLAANEGRMMNQMQQSRRDRRSGYDGRGNGPDDDDRSDSDENRGNNDR